jgi:hypothetical protein
LCSARATRSGPTSFTLRESRIAQAREQEGRHPSWRGSSHYDFPGHPRGCSHHSLRPATTRRADTGAHPERPGCGHGCMSGGRR